MVDLRRGQRTALIATVITVGLAVVKGVVGYLAGSVALLADALHSATDVLGIGASWFGLRLASRERTERFPYGFHKAESLATLAIAAFILFAGFQIGLEGIRRVRATPHLEMPLLAIAVALVSAAVSFGIARAERRVGREINAQSLLATADESRMDAFSSLLVFAALVASMFHVPYVEGILAIGLALLILWVGLSNGRVAIYSLMDASLDPEMEQQVVEVVQEVAGVREVHQLRLRRAGPFCFGEAHVLVAKSLDVARGHEIAEEVETCVKERFPSVDSFVTHLEPYRSKQRRVMIPLEDSRGLDSPVMEHFGRAKYFLFADVDGEEITSFDIKPNEFQDRKVRAGLNVVKHFIDSESIEALITPHIGEIGFHAARDHYVEIYGAEDGQSARQALQDLAIGRLALLSSPTHSSDGRTEEDSTPAETRP